MCRDVSPASELRAEIQMKRGYLILTKNLQKSETIDLQALFDDYWSSSKHEFTISSQCDHEAVVSYLTRGAEDLVIGKHRWSLELRFSANTTVRLLLCLPIQAALIVSSKLESLRLSLQELEGLLTVYSPLMGASTEKAVQTVLNYGTVFAEVCSSNGNQQANDTF